MAEILCGAKTRGGPACRKPAGWGTGHTGSGRCRFHEGVYGSIWLDRLTGEERKLHDQVDPDPRAQAEEEIRLLTIRERRMLERIEASEPGRDLRYLEDTFTRVQQCKARFVEMLRRIEAEETGEKAAGEIRAVIELMREQGVHELSTTHGETSRVDPGIGGPDQHLGRGGSLR